MKNEHLEPDRVRAELLDAIMPHVPFDGWSEPAFRAAVEDAGLDPALAAVICPRGAVDLAVAYHRAGDRAMLDALGATDLGGMKFRDKVATAVRLRLEPADRELVRRGMALFALPQHAGVGAGLVWGTVDAIWTALGDESRDYNWYSKRLTLSGVYSATVLFWIGDDSAGHADTWDFLDRRIVDVMQFERIKGQVLRLPGLGAILGKVRAPSPQGDLPGALSGKEHAQ